MCAKKVKPPKTIANLPFSANTHRARQTVSCKNDMLSFHQDVKPSETVSIKTYMLHVPMKDTSDSEMGRMIQSTMS